MQAGTGWSRTFLNAGLSLGLLAWGICALPVGAWIQRRGGRGVMALASGMGGAGLIVMGGWPHPIAYVVAWLFLGAALAGMLYDSAFAVVTAALTALWRFASPSWCRRSRPDLGSIDRAEAGNRYCQPKC